MTETINLLQFTTNAGCSCKIPPQKLQSMLQHEHEVLDSSLLVGNNTNDDAAVYRLTDEQSLISTCDFFTPIDADAFTYGQIAAANAISDVYAMGGKPIMATAILAWPVEKISDAIAQEVLKGARQSCQEAGISLAGGHSVMASEPLFGLNVTGLVAAQQVKRNNTAAAGDVLFLTKPIGLGILTSAQKRAQLLEAHEGLAAQVMTQLNKVGAALGSISGVTAMTDITGFGLAGHLIEMCDNNRLSVVLNWQHLPIITDLSYYIKNRIGPDATFRNWQSYGSLVGFDKAVPVMDAFSLLPDPQTNGGLCIAVRPSAVREVIEVLTAHGLEKFCTPIGYFTEPLEKAITVSP